MGGLATAATSAFMVVSAPFGMAWADHAASTASTISMPSLAPDAVAERGNAWIARQVDRLMKLPPNWDGYGADPVDKSLLTSIAQILDDYLPVGSPAGSLVPGADGSVQAEWHLRKGSFGLCLDDGVLSAWMRSAGSRDETERTGLEALNLIQAAALHSMA